MKKHILMLSSPIIIMFVYISYHYYKFHQSNQFIYFPISGYDPRSIISGHYIHFKIQQNPTINCNRENEILCGCIQHTIDKMNLSIGEIKLPLNECTKMHCKPKIQLQCINQEFIIPHTKFYLSEKFETLIPTIPLNSYVLLKIDEEGKSYIENLYVYDEISQRLITLEEYIVKKEYNKNQ